MKKLFAMAFGLVLSVIAACTSTGAPDSRQVQAIQNACAVDAGVRPVVTVLLATPGLATPDEVAAVAAARAVIDPVCSNPAGSVQANAIAAVTGASAQIVGIVTQLQARQAASAK